MSTTVTTVMVNKKSNFAIQKLLWVSKALSTDKTRYMLNSMLFQAIENYPDIVRIVATDGRRLHTAIIPLYMVNDIPELYISPADGSEAYGMNCKGSKTRIEFSGKCEYLFPDWKRVMPEKKNGTRIALEKYDDTEFFSRIMIAIQERELKIPAVNVHYMMDVQEMEPQIITYVDVHKPLRFDNEVNETTALVMPLMR